MAYKNKNIKKFIPVPGPGDSVSKIKDYMMQSPDHHNMYTKILMDCPFSEYNKKCLKVWNEISKLYSQYVNKQFRRREVNSLCKEPAKTCSICKKEFVGFGNNPQPVNDLSVEDRCCDDCNDTVVIPKRFECPKSIIDKLIPD
jgi:hypothetical protein